MTASKNALLGILLLGACASCSEKGEKVEMFTGECSIHVKSKTEDAEILVDGIELGHGEVKSDVPCGEKLVVIEHEGYLPFNQYYPLVKGQPLYLTVELEKLKPMVNPALDPGLVEKVRGQAVATASTATAPKAAAPTAGAAPSAASAASPAEDSVENWR